VPSRGCLPTHIDLGKLFNVDDIFDVLYSTVQYCTGDRGRRDGIEFMPLLCGREDSSFEFPVQFVDFSM
jgi:hypothetical protein